MARELVRDDEARTAMIQRLAIFGATGDLTGRYLLPGLAALHEAGYLPGGFQIIAAGRENWHDADFRKHAAAWLDTEASDVSPAARKAIVDASSYRRLDLADPASVASCAGGSPVVAYLALPPAVFPVAVRALHQAGFSPESRVVLEKPFGEDLSSAMELNRLLTSLMDERQIFRVDHFLAMTTVQTVLGTRLANRVLEPIWNSAQIAEIEIVWEESLALEGRAAYYDGVGALKDMLQNHLLQILCLVAMEPPLSVNERDLRDHKVDVLRAIRPLDKKQASFSSRRGRYTAGRLGDRDVLSYLDESGVVPERHTETFAEMTLGLESWRWSGTRFRLRTGKAFARDRKEVIVHFRPVPHLPFAAHDDVPPNRLRFGLEPQGLSLELTGGGPGATFTLVPLALRAQLEPPHLPAYGRLLLDALSGNPTLSIRGDEAEESWRVVTPVIEAWADDLVPMEEYPAGSNGPSRSDTADQAGHRNND